MTNNIVVSDATPLIALEKIANGFDFIKKVYHKILVPRQVLEEIAQKESSESAYLLKHALHDLIEEKNPVNIAIFSENQALDDGEKYAIALAVEENLPILIHERKGRKVARELNLKVTGIAGEVLRAYKNGIIEKSEAVSLINHLYSASQINNYVYRQIISAINSIQ